MSKPSKPGKIVRKKMWGVFLYGTLMCFYYSRQGALGNGEVAHGDAIVRPIIIEYREKKGA